ncbi:MAG TPA: phosphogluconate dehydratase [Limnobacter sp.]|uniref:phosphogluconate dehydratase n=1 Tax=Limnobacter sp. TaxID=2003368 RepID=UPI002EDB9DB4
MSTILHPALLKVRDAIEARSKSTRSRYLGTLPAATQNRSAVGAANLAHTTAVFAPPTKRVIALHKAPHLGIVTAYNDMLSAHQPFADYPARIAQAAQLVGATTQVAGGTPAMCDGVTQGREGMELSLFSRDVIAQAACIGLSHNVFDGGILLGVCDKIAPGLLMGALAFGHLPFVFIPAGPMETGLSNPEKARIRQLAAEGKAGKDELLQAEERAYHSPGTCTFYGTANSNQLMLDCMGLQFPGAAFESPFGPQRNAVLTDSVRALASATRNPALALGQLVNAASLINALVGLMASGGSTNHTIHWIAVARAAGYVIDWTDLDAISAVVPLLCRVYPNGVEDVNAFHAAGGTASLLATLMDGGFVDGSALTVWGKTLADTVGEVEPHQETFSVRKPQATRNPEVLRPWDQPFQPDGGIRLLTGNLGRAVCKVSAVKHSHRVVQAPCRVFTDQAQVMEAFKNNAFQTDVVVVVTHQGPRANGMPELHKLTPVLGVLLDRGLNVALVTDGRMSGASGKVLAAIHVCPEADSNGPLSKLRDGDLVRVDAVAGVLNTDADLDRREPSPKQAQAVSLGRGYFQLWRQHVTTAEEGASVLFGTPDVQS